MRKGIQMKVNAASLALSLVVIAGMASVAAASGPYYSAQFLDKETVSFKERTSWSVSVLPFNGTDIVTLSGHAGHRHLVTTSDTSTYSSAWSKDPAPIAEFGCVLDDVSWGIADSDFSGCEATTTGNAKANAQWYGPSHSGSAVFNGGSAESMFQWSRQYFMEWGGGTASYDNYFGFGDAEVCATNKTRANIACDGDVIVEIGVNITPDFWVDNYERAFCSPLSGCSGVTNWIPHPQVGPVATYTLEVVAIVEYSTGPVEYTLFDGTMSTVGDGNIIADGDFLMFTYAGQADSDCSCATGHQDWDFGNSSLWAEANYKHLSSPASPGFIPSTLTLMPTYTGDIKSVTVVRRAYSDGIQEPCDFTLGCPPCPADFDMSGGVDSGDLAAFFAAYESGDPCADLDASGGIDSGDLAAFFAVYELGGCE